MKAHTLVYKHVHPNIHTYTHTNTHSKTHTLKHIYIRFHTYTHLILNRGSCICGHSFKKVRLYHKLNECVAYLFTSFNCENRYY